jgi:hypothetical protein
MKAAREGVRMSNDDRLTPAAINQIAWDVVERKADPKDARLLLEHFRDCYDRREPIPHELSMHLRDSFAAYLSGKQSIESALGLVRKTGRPTADPDMRIAMATEVLRLRLVQRATYEDAVAQVGDAFGWGKTIVGEAWEAHRQDALLTLRCEKALDSYPWTDDEQARLNEIFDGVPGFITPGKSGNKAE